MPRLLIRWVLWALCALAALVFAFVVATAAAFAETPKLSAPEAKDKVASGEMVLLDIRSPQEWAETGVAKGAWPVSMHTPEFGGHLQQILTKYDPAQIALICATGGRTAYVTDLLAKNGLSGIADVSEGMFGNGTGAGWIERGLPIVSADEAAAQYTTAQQEWN